MTSHSIVLGGLGGDSHSVGLHILRMALSGAGYRVIFLGTQNRLERFFEYAPFASVVMISNMDGHAKHYLQNFPELRQQHGHSGASWYLGGNLAIDHGIGYERLFMEMGFDRVFVKFVDVATVLQILEADLHAKKPVFVPETADPSRSPAATALPIPNDQKLEWDDVLKQRAEVLDHWKTGVGAKDLRDNAAFLLRQQPSFAAAQQTVDETKGHPLVQPRCGVALPHQQTRLFLALKAGGADMLSYQVDSLTRNNNYAGAEEEIRNSRLENRSTLNGFPVVNHGVAALRRITQAVQTPLQVRHSTRDPRLLAEISLAGGTTGYEGGAICYNIPYYKEYPLEESIERWKYVDRLCGYYAEEFGVIVDREFFGVLTATLIPPSLAITICILESLLASRQGVKSVSLGYAEQGNRNQDIAAIRMIRELARKYLDSFGFKHVSVHAIFHQYMAAFPQDPQKSEELILRSSQTAALSGATRILTKTPAEALKVPSTEDNLEGLQLTRQGFGLAEDFFPDEAIIAEECQMIREEVDSLMSSVISLGGGCLAAGVVKAFKIGALDVPFSPSVHCAGEVETVRDHTGAVRFSSTARLPFPANVKAFHRDRISSRRRAEKLFSTQGNYLLVERDVLRIARGQYHSWPLEN